MKQDLNELEYELFDAISTKKEGDVLRIINQEVIDMILGLPPKIRPDCIDTDGNTYSHLAAKTGVKDIIDCILLSSINFCYTKPNYAQLLPENLDWSGRYKKTLATRVKSDQIAAREKTLKEQLLAKTEEIQKDEIATGRYLPGIIFTKDFRLVYKNKSNKAEKLCVIDELSAHDRQALDEAVYANRYEYKERGWSEYPVNIPSENFLLANIGLVMGDEAYQKPNTIKRSFYSLPIFLDPTVTLPKNRQTNGHTERNLFDILLTPQYLQKVLISFMQRLNLTPNKKPKIYACVLDMHSSQDMCDACEFSGYDFEESFARLLKSTLQDLGFEFCAKNLAIAIRVSSSKAPTGSSFRVQIHERSSVTQAEYQKYPARECTHTELMDIKQSKKFILHYDEETRRDRGAVWYNKQQIFKSTFENIPPRSLFFVSRGSAVHTNPPFKDHYTLRTDDDLDAFYKPK